MPDRRQHRGANPEDQKYFSTKQLAPLKEAAVDLCWLMSKGYKRDSALKLVGDRYALHERQRRALGRAVCSDEQLLSRRQRQVTADKLRGQVLLVDGYNVLITIEAALAGGVILASRDSTYRDLASLSGSFRKVEETVPALKLLAAHLSALALKRCTIYLDQPVSNSGRLKEVIYKSLEGAPFELVVELVRNPDRLLLTAPETVASADSQVLDGVARWYNLARQVIVQAVPQIWLIELNLGEGSTFQPQNGGEPLL